MASVSRFGEATEPEIEMVAADDDRCFQLAAAHHLVEGESKPVAVAEPDPAYARRQTLKRDAVAGHVEPVMQMRVAGRSVPSPWRQSCKCLPDRPIAPPSGMARCPGRTEDGYRRDEAGEGEGVFQSFVLGDLAYVVAIVERRNTSFPEGDHGFDMFAHRSTRGFLDGFRVRFALLAPFGQSPAFWQIAVDRIMGRGLVGDACPGAHCAGRVQAGYRRHCRAGQPIWLRPPWSSGRSFRVLHPVFPAFAST